MKFDPSNGEPAIELEAVDVPASGSPSEVMVPGVDWRVRIGERWLISGPARSGKSSLVGVAAGLIRPVRGRHRLFGRDLASLGESERTALRLHVGVVFGSGGRLFPTLNVIQNLSLPLLYHSAHEVRENSSRVAKVLSALGLEAYARWAPGDLPRGVAHRVALARALMLRPSVLVLDEPILGLPLEEAAWWQEFLDGGAEAIVGAEWSPKTWVIAATESRPWEGWAGCRARVQGGRWQVVSQDVGLRP
ncbi:MAG: ATP-binding cassette domain-containing protein [Limisphaerales bacterium]